MTCECKIDIITAIITFLGFTLAFYQFKKSNKEKSISNVIALKAELRQYDDIYFKLLPTCDKNDFFKDIKLNCEELGRLYSYLGLFEVSYLLMKNNSLSKKEFKVFFNYRLELIYRNNNIRALLEEQKENWTNLWELIEFINLK